MGDIKDKIQSVYESTGDFTAEDVENFSEGQVVRVYVAGRIIVGKLTNKTLVEERPLHTPASATIIIDFEKSEIPDDPEYELRRNKLDLKSGSMRGEDSPQDKFSASIQEKRGSRLLGVVGHMESF